MAGKGPAPTPKALLKLAGTDRKRKDRHGAGEPIEVPGEFPGCPTWLSANAKAEWCRIAKVLGSVDGMVVGTDLAVLIGYCHAFDQFHRLDKKVGTKDVLKDNCGKYYKNPAAVMMADARTAMLRFAQELGFSPASRSRVRVPEKPKGGESEFKVDMG